MQFVGYDIEILFFRRLLKIIATGNLLISLISFYVGKVLSRAHGGTWAFTEPTFGSSITSSSVSKNEPRKQNLETNGVQCDNNTSHALFSYPNIATLLVG